MSDDLKSASQIAATLVTVLCAAIAAFTWWVSVRATGTGGAGMVIVFPIIAMVGAHVVLGPVAMILALLTRRFWRNTWIYGYFLLIGPTMLTTLSGGSPIQVLGRTFNNVVSEWTDTREHPDETGLCEALADSLTTTGGERVPAVLLEFDPAPGFDLDYRCWQRSAPVPRHLDKQLRRASFVEIAVAAGETRVLETLFARGVDVNTRGAEGVTPLLFALSAGAPVSREAGLQRRRFMHALRPRIDFLLATGADPTLATALGVTPLHWAAALGDVALVSRFLAASTYADAAAGYGGKTPVELAIGAVQVTIGTTGPRLEPPAYYDEVVTAYSEVLRRLFAAGADLDAVLPLGGQRGNIWLLGFLSAEGIDLLPHVPKHGRQWLDVALHARDEALLDWLIAAGVDINAFGRGGETLLHTFSYPGLEWQLGWALQAGADVNRVNSRGKTPLEVMVSHRNEAGVTRLLEAGAVVTPAARKLATPAIEAALDSAQR